MKRTPQIGDDKQPPRPQRPRSYASRARPPADAEAAAATAGPSFQVRDTAHSSPAAKQQAASSLYSFAEPVSQQTSRSRSLEVPRDRHPSHQKRDLTPAARIKKTVRIALPHRTPQVSVATSAVTSSNGAAISRRATDVTPAETAFLSVESSPRATDSVIQSDPPAPRAPQQIVSTVTSFVHSETSPHVTETRAVCQRRASVTNSECSGIDELLRMLDRDPGTSAASSPRTAFESDLIFLAQSAACSFASRGMLRAMARYAKSREEALRNSGILESPLTEAEQRELALIRDECRFPARTPATPVRRPFSAVDPGSEGESVAKRPCAVAPTAATPGSTGDPRLAPGRRLDLGPPVQPPPLTVPPPAAPLAGRAGNANAPPGATGASPGPAAPVAPADDDAAPALVAPSSYAAMVTAPTVHAQPPRAPVAPKKPSYPPIVIEFLPNYVHHLGKISQLLGRSANTRAYGEHRAADCTRPRDVPATCANCGGPHPACHSSCPVRKEEEQNRRAGTFARTAPSRSLRQRHEQPQKETSQQTTSATSAAAPSTSGVAPTGEADDFITVRHRTRRGGRRRGRAPPSLAAQEASRAAALHAVTTDVANRATTAATTPTPAHERAATAPPRTAPSSRSRTRSRARRPQMEEALSAIANILQAVQAGDNPAALFRRAASAFKGPTRGRSRR
ncbi:protein app1-like [Pieris rapae]|uniref:protein app1-like n=1 Tax=Pieris rapae TaxID=64459 RepID=UPI001E27B3E3|nr:protein app1-like [Pieris rapae]